MGWKEQRQEWIARLSPMKGWTLPRLKEVEWLTQKAELTSTQRIGKSSRGTGAAASPRRTGLRVSFPLRIGMGMGVGGIDTSTLAFQIVHLKIGAETSYFAEDSADDVLRSQRKRVSKLGRRLETAGNVANAASILLVAQAFCGPVVSLTMACMAAADFTRFAVGHILHFLHGESHVSRLLDGLRWPSRIQDFSTASLLLSIGVPVLKHQHPTLHYTLECVGAAIPVAVGYAQTKALVKNSPVGGSGAGERLWRSRHRWAARRLCVYMTDFRHRPALGWLLDICDETNVIINGSWLFVGSTALPSRLASNQSDDKNIYPEDVVSIKRTSNMPVVTEVMNTQTNNLSVPSEDWGYGSVSTWRDRQDDIFMEFSVVLTGWTRLRQTSSLLFRACYLVLVFGPLIILGPMIFFFSSVLVSAWTFQLRKVLWWLLRFCLERGGAAFIKWGQWSATREDLFPEDMCLYLGRLHDRAPEHSYAETRKAVLQYLGRPIEDIFDDFPRKPCASGSIAQVYRAKLKDQREGMPSEVAVKVRHPSVALRIYQDFQIMSAIANWAQELPALRWLKLRESVDQFSHTLTAQADLRVEAVNLARFHRNFEGLSSTVIFPKLIPDLVSEGVIVEGFERGAALHEFLRQRSSLNTQIAAVGVDTYLKMMLTDNFVHTDLHPGNILARSADDAEGVQQKLQLVLLDFGLAEELSPCVRHHFISFIMMIGAGNGERAAYHLLQFSWPHEQTCPRPRALAADMNDLFAQECNLQREAIDLNKVLIKVLQLCGKHEVTIDSAYASLVIAVCVLVGFARSLDPELSIMDAAVPCLFTYNLTGRIQGRIYG